MIFDIHTHAFPDALAERAIASLSACGGIPPHTDGTCAGLRASMRRAGIAYSAIMPIATKPAQARSINEWATQVNRQYDDLIAFGTLHPAQEDFAAEIDRLAADGIAGIKLHPDYQQFFVDDKALFPLYRALADAGLILMLHAGVDIGLPPPVHCPPDRLARLLDAVPNLTVIAAHMGGYDLWDEVEKYLVGRELYLDTSYSFTDLGPERMAAIITAHTPHRVLFGTDSPWTEQATEVQNITSLPLPDADKAGILGGNAGRLLKLGNRI